MRGTAHQRVDIYEKYVISTMEYPRGYFLEQKQFILYITDFVSRSKLLWCIVIADVTKLFNSRSKCKVYMS